MCFLDAVEMTADRRFAGRLFRFFIDNTEIFR